MNPFRWSFRQQFLFGFVICAALLGYAFYVQFQLGMQPCPFCIFQRICFRRAGAGVPAGSAACAACAPARRKAWGVLAFAAAAAGMAVCGSSQLGATASARAAQLRAGPELHASSSTPGWARHARCCTATGDCSSIDWQFLGLSMPMWALLWFVVLGFGALYAGFLRRQVHRFRR